MNYYPSKEYIRMFIDSLAIKIENIVEINELINIFNQFNSNNWNEIDNYKFNEDEYFFLRLKVFILTIDFETDKRKDLEWLEFFKSKYIEYSI